MENVMFNRILVPIDGSATSNAGLPKRSVWRG